MKFFNLILLCSLIAILGCRKTRLVENSSIEQIVKGRVNVSVELSKEAEKYITADKILKCIMELDEQGVKRGTAYIITKVTDSFNETKDSNFLYYFQAMVTVKDKDENVVLKQQIGISLDKGDRVSLNRLASTNGLPAIVYIDVVGDVIKKEKEKRVKPPEK